MNQAYAVKKAKVTQVTDAQKKVLLEYLKNNKDLQSGKFTNKFTYKDAQKKWNEVAEMLNSMPGSSKDWKSWRKVSPV